MFVLLKFCYRDWTGLPESQASQAEMGFLVHLATREQRALLEHPGKQAHLDQRGQQGRTLYCQRFV